MFYTAKQNDIFMSSLSPKVRHSSPPLTSGGSEAVQESAVEPPMAAGNVRTVWYKHSLLPAL